MPITPPPSPTPAHLPLNIPQHRLRLQTPPPPLPGILLRSEQAPFVLLNSVPHPSRHDIQRPPLLPLLPLQLLRVPPRLRRRPGPRRIRSQTRVLRLPPRLPRPPLRLVSGCSEFRCECLEQKGGEGGRRRVSGSVCTKGLYHSVYEGVVFQCGMCQVQYKGFQVSV